MLLKVRKAHVLSLFIIVLATIVSIVVYPKLPPVIASHWGISGEVNGYMSRFWGLFIMPIISFVMLLLFLFLPALDPKKENIQKFVDHFDNFILVMFTFLFYLHILVIVWNLGYDFNLMQFLAPAFAVLFYFTGTLVENAQPNWFIGIRTPWTLSSPIVWEKTHKTGGKLFKLTAAISLLGVAFPNLLFLFILIPAISLAIFSFVYSYILYTKLPN
jgi:uncharacterized membrane protein